MNLSEFLQLNDASQYMQGVARLHVDTDNNGT